MRTTIKSWLRLVCFMTVSLGILSSGCDSNSLGTGPDASAEDAIGRYEHCENYPNFNPVIDFDDVVPPIGWSKAYRRDGTRQDFSFENFFCGDAYADKRTLIIVVGAGWCQSCARLIETQIAPVATNLITNLGVELVYLEVQDTQYQPADSEFAYRHLRNLINDGLGWRVGDADTLIREGNEMVAAPRFISQQMNLPTLPAVWVIRKRDMRIIATRELAWQSRPGELPLELIAMDPERDWREPPLPPFVNQCEAGDEEETQGATNNVMQNATAIEPGLHSGGICDSEPDFYTFDVEGPWQFSVTHDIRQGDLDVVLWDTQRDLAALDDDGRIVGSLTAETIETLIGEGPAVVQIRGYGGSSASYAIRLEAR